MSQITAGKRGEGPHVDPQSWITRDLPSLTYFGLWISSISNNFSDYLLHTTNVCSGDSGEGEHGEISPPKMRGKCEKM